MIEIEQLRYVLLGSADLAGAGDFAERILGLERVERTEALARYRSDSRDYTLAFLNSQPGFQAVGFEVRFPSALAELCETLPRHGLSAQRGSEEEARLRKVREFIWFNDHSGNRIEICVRPMNSGWRYFPSRDAGITGLQAVVLRSTAHEKDEALWTQLLGAKVTDWAGNAAYLAVDSAHHRLMLVPAAKAGVLAVEYGVENVNLLMRNYYVLQNTQIPIMHGPGRRPASEQLFLTFAGPEGVLYGFVSEGRMADSSARPRQFPSGPGGLCGWGSDNKIEEFRAAGAER